MEFVVGAAARRNENKLSRETLFEEIDKFNAWTGIWADSVIHLHDDANLLPDFSGFAETHTESICHS